jgi:uncharacterized protein YkwD
MLEPVVGPSMRRRGTPLGRPALVAAGVALFLVACGGDEGGDGAQGQPERVQIGKAQAASNDPDASKDVVGRATGIVVGQPRLDPEIAKTPRGGVSGRAQCVGVELVPSSENLAQVRKAILCLLNAERNARGLQPLSENGKLAAAALAHAGDMVRKNYFSHTSRTGSSVLKRVQQSGYLSQVRRFIVGENIVYGTGSLAGPTKIVETWMGSPPHRANILQRRFKEIGLGAALGTPKANDSGATFVAKFGARSR